MTGDRREGPQTQEIIEQVKVRRNVPDGDTLLEWLVGSRPSVEILTEWMDAVGSPLQPLAVYHDPPIVGRMNRAYVHVLYSTTATVGRPETVVVSPLGYICREWPSGNLQAMITLRDFVTFPDLDLTHADFASRQFVQSVERALIGGTEIPLPPATLYRYYQALLSRFDLGVAPRIPSALVLPDTGAILLQPPAPLEPASPPIYSGTESLDPVDTNPPQPETGYVGKPELPGPDPALPETLEIQAVPPPEVSAPEPFAASLPVEFLGAAQAPVPIGVAAPVMPAVLDDPPLPPLASIPETALLKMDAVARPAVVSNIAPPVPVTPAEFGTLDSFVAPVDRRQLQPQATQTFAAKIQNRMAQAIETAKKAQVESRQEPAANTSLEDTMELQDFLKKIQ